MKTLPTLVLLSLVALAAPAAAADLTVDLHLPNGTPVRDAVVTLTPTAGPVPAAASRLGGPFQMAQEKIQFHPFVLLVPVGATVAFPNLDKVRHHVYSFSPARTFELKLFGQEDHRTVTFDKPGVVALGCNIHDRMLGYIYVSDTPYAAHSDEHGQVQLHNLPEGFAVAFAAFTDFGPIMALAIAIHNIPEVCVGACREASPPAGACSLRMCL